MVNEFLAIKPFDLYELHLLQLVARRGSFTAAAREAGLTQSAITRQVQGVESRLGISLFERTTRHVALTPAGTFLLHESARITGDLDAVLQRLRDEFSKTQKEVRVGVSMTISTAYLPGFFFAQQRKQPHVRLRVMHRASKSLLAALEGNELDVAVMCPPRNLPKGLLATHRFEDAFDLIIPTEAPHPPSDPKNARNRWQQWLHGCHWLLITENSNTGPRLRKWLRKQRWFNCGGTELDSFDLITNLVALGQGVSVVPKRTLAI